MSIIILGAVFIGIGIIGKISIEIDKNKLNIPELSLKQRYSFGFFGLFFIIFGVWTYLKLPIQSSPVPIQTPAAISDLPQKDQSSDTPTLPTQVGGPTNVTNTSTLPARIGGPVQITYTPTLPTPAGGLASNAPPIGWQKFKGLPDQINDLAASPENPLVIYAATGDKTGAGGGVFKTKDGGVSWQSMSNGLPSQSVLALAFDHQTPPTLYALVDNRSEIYSTIDEGAQWTLRGKTGDIGDLEVRLVFGTKQGDAFFMLMKSERLYRSRDSGATWQSIGAGLPGDTQSQETYAQSLALDPVNPDIIYVGTGGFVGGGHGVYKSSDGGNTWTAMNNGIYALKVSALALDPSDPKTIFAGGDNGQLFKSHDGGQNWDDLTSLLPIQSSSHPAIENIYIHHSMPNAIYLVVEDAGIITSFDSGKTWGLLGQPGGFPYTTFSAFMYNLEMHGFPTFILGIDGGGGWLYTLATPSP